MRLKNGPPCGPNAIVFTISPTHGPQVGKSVSVMERSSIDPKTSILVKVFRDCNQEPSLSARSNFDAARHVLSESGDIYSGLEVWKLSDVIFLNDAPSILGRVVAIDKQQAIVDCAHNEAPMREGSSVPISSLRVFRLTELEPCIEGPDFQPAMTSSSMTSSTMTSSSKSGGILSLMQRMVTRHTAGTVQHRPVCIVDPAPFTSPSTRRMNTDSLPLSPHRLTGFRPLAVHATDLGPNLLVERIADRTTFLVCSAHLTTPTLNVTSFVAIGNHDSKPKHCTIPEEAVNSVEAGFVFNPSLTRFTKKQEALDTNDVAMATSKSGDGAKTTGKEISGKKRTLSRKGKTVISQVKDSSIRQVATSGSHSIPIGTECEFVQLSTSHPNLFFVRDISGTIWPLLDGLCLKCTTSGLGGGPSGLVTKGPPVPQQSYRSITSRQYYVQGHGDVTILVLSK